MNLLEIDQEVDFLKTALKALDPTFQEINNAITIGIANGLDVDSSGLCDKGEFIVGLAFTACQRYITSTIGWFQIPKDTAFKIGKTYRNTTTYVQIINAAANYWKHSDEWDCISFFQETDSELVKIIPRDYSKLVRQPKKTIDVIQNATPWRDYLCSNVFYELTSPKDLNLLALIPILSEWRSELIKFEKG